MTAATTKRNLSPRSVLNFVEDEMQMPIQMDDVSLLTTSSCTTLSSFRRGEKRKIWCLSLDDHFPEGRHHGEEKEHCYRALNFRHRLVCDQTVEWLAASSSTAAAGGRKLQELRLGPVFESSRTLLAAITSLPVSVTHLDLDLRNDLRLLPKAMPLLFHKSHLVNLSIRLFGDSGALELSKCLHLNPNLKRLDLGDNRIGSEGVRAIARAIIDCSLSLEDLDLSCNCIIDVDPIGELLEINSSLRSLDISFNWIGNAEVERLCHGLRTNTSLHRLNLFGCQRISQVGMSALSKCLQDHNSSLHHICLPNNNIFEIAAYSGYSNSHRLEQHSQSQLQIVHWLSLNRAGRFLLRRDENDSAQSPLWPLLLAKNNGDSTTLYHILQQGGTQLFGR